MGEFLNSLTSSEVLVWAVAIGYAVVTTANMVLRALNARISRKIKQTRKEIEILNRRPEGVVWPTNEQIKIMTKHAEESGNPDDKKVLSAMMKSREYFVGDGFTELPKGVRREIDEALEILRKRNPEEE